mmetsp:Transcript_6000/g.14876  ORF Transcript_6000/g.14876 Transcript_6000/m.14876 type:complete len:436 (-) Transcript_6000:164-1471(-)
MSMPRPGAGEGDEDPEPAQLDTVYELDATAAWVRAGGYTRVALQMPDELLHDAVAVAAALVRRCNAGTEPSGTGVAVRAFVLADTTFGSCCVDEVAAAHHAADCIVHFGRACMSPVSRLPARFVFNKVHVDTAACAAAIREHAVALAAANIAAAAASLDLYTRLHLRPQLHLLHVHLAARLVESFVKLFLFGFESFAMLLCLPLEALVMLLLFLLVPQPPLLILSFDSPPPRLHRLLRRGRRVVISFSVMLLHVAAPNEPAGHALALDLRLRPDSTLAPPGGFSLFVILILRLLSPPLVSHLGLIDRLFISFGLLILTFVDATTVFGANRFPDMLLSSGGKSFTLAFAIAAIAQLVATGVVAESFFPILLPCLLFHTWLSLGRRPSPCLRTRTCPHLHLCFCLDLVRLGVAVVVGLTAGALRIRAAKQDTEMFSR